MAQKLASMQDNVGNDDPSSLEQNWGASLSQEGRGEGQPPGGATEEGRQTGLVARPPRDKVHFKKQTDSIASDTAVETYALPQLSAALEAFVCARNDRGCVTEELPFRDLVDFLYLGGQTKVRRFCCE